MQHGGEETTARSTSRGSTLPEYPNRQIGRAFIPWRFAAMNPQPLYPRFQEERKASQSLRQAAAPSPSLKPPKALARRRRRWPRRVERPWGDAVALSPGWRRRGASGCDSKRWVRLGLALRLCSTTPSWPSHPSTGRTWHTARLLSARGGRGDPWRRETKPEAQPAQK